MNTASAPLPNGEDIWELYQRLERETGDRGYASTVEHLKRNGFEAISYGDVVRACEGRRLQRDGIERVGHHLRKLARPAFWLSHLWLQDMRFRGVEVGGGGYCKGQVDIERNGGRIVVGSRVEFGKGTLLQTAPRGELIIGDDAMINRDNVLSAGSRIEIGTHCVFAPGVSLYDSEHSFRDRSHIIKSVPGTSAPIIIGPGCWLASRVTVLKGVCIGEGAVVGAHSVVKDDVPDFAIAVGIPARVVGYRE